MKLRIEKITDGNGKITYLVVPTIFYGKISLKNWLWYYEADNELEAREFINSQKIKKEIIDDEIRTY